MGILVATLMLPSSTYTQLPHAKIFFMENGVMKRLTLEEWKAYFPGCGDPMVMIEGSQGNPEQVWTGQITDRLAPMLREAGMPSFVTGVTALSILPSVTDALTQLRNHASEFQNRHRLTALEEDREPPTAWTLLTFLRDFHEACARYPTATVTWTHYWRSFADIGATVHGATASIRRD